ncbi:MAG: 16S rRNA (cytidine(1402)-2'-O)-methyltransferase [Actinomycetota bacterium]|nr:16S rRNA (cytidine(1402)-2'-O)-methyltransferase [Actinomycetota bacterium]
MSGRLVLVGTPIGNLEDTSRRAIRTLEEAEVIACEDTRRARKLLSHFGIRARELVTYHEANERRQARLLLERIAAGTKVVLISDAGMPGLSDPGFRLVEACAQRGYEVVVVPGPNAAVSALAISGLPPGRFVFEGFLPRKSGERRRRIAQLIAEERTIVFYESPHRIAGSLGDLLEGLGNRPAVVARELTKMYETAHRGTLGELRELAEEGIFRGEIVVVVSGAVRDSAEPPESQELAVRVAQLIEGGMDRKTAMTTVASEAGVSRRVVFDALVAARDPED